MDDYVDVEVLKRPKRGPGGHYYTYRACYANMILGVVGYGQTAMEARQSLTKLKEQETPPPVKGEQHVGWFVWVKRNGLVNYHKYIVEGDQVHSDTKKYYESFEVKKFPIMTAEWNLPLDEMAKRYPLPAELGGQADAS